MSNRGEMTQEVQEAAIKHLKLEVHKDAFSTTELRLIPYVQYVLMNERVIVSNRVNQEEIDIIEKWKKKGWIMEGENEKISVTKEFWDAMSEILWIAYAK